MFAQEFEHRRDAVLDRWVESVMDAYPDQTTKFLKEQPDRFANPVGASLREGLAEIIDGLVTGVSPEELTEPLDLVIRIRAVQEFTPADAVSFIFDLKSIVREIVANGSDVPQSFDATVDRLALAAFEVYTNCREQLWRIRADQIRNQSLGVLERMQAWRERRDRESETTSS